MKKTYLVLAFLITGFLLAGNAYGEDEVYYCAGTGNGFNYQKESGSYEPTRFEDMKFKFKLDRASNNIEMTSEIPSIGGLYICITPFSLVSSLAMSCMESLHHLNFNPKNGRFSFFMGGGHVLGDVDSLAVAYGKCDKF